MRTTPRSRRRALWCLAAGLSASALALGLMLVSPTAAPAGLSVTDAGVVPDRPTVADASTAVSSTLPSADRSAAPAAPPTNVPAAPTTSAGSPSTDAAEPTSIVLPTLGVSAAVVPVGVTDDGLLEVPADVAEIGWYRFGPAPGDATGSAVLTGHVDSADQGPGVFASLGLLNPGDPVDVVDDTGATIRFDVVSRESWAKPDVPLDRLFDRTGPGRLVLITCGGVFDRAALSYEENIAITAVRVP